MRSEPIFIQQEARFIDKVTIWGLMATVLLLLYALWMAADPDYIVGVVNSDQQVCSKLGGEITGSGEDTTCSL